MDPRECAQRPMFKAVVTFKGYERQVSRKVKRKLNKASTLKYIVALFVLIKVLYQVNIRVLLLQRGE
jgi:hypothetical protein